MKRPLLAVLVLFFVGCAVKTSPPAVLPALDDAPDWQVAEYQVLSSRLFQVEQYAAMQGYIAQVMAHNPDLNSIAATVAAVEHEVDIAGAAARPQADLQLSQTRSKDTFSKEISSTNSVSMDVSWILDVWGRLADETAAVQHQLDGAYHDLAHSKRALIVQSAQSWVEYWGYIRSVDSLLQLAKMDADLLDSYQHSYVAGMASYELTIDASNRKKAGQLRLWETQLEKQKLLHHMNTLRGQLPTDELEVNDGHVPSGLVAFNGEVSATLLVDRPDIQRAFEEVAALELSARAAHKALLPHINLNGSALKSGVSLDNALSADLVWQFIGGLTQPIFNGGQLKAIARKKSAQAEASWWGYQYVVLNAMHEVEDSIISDRLLARKLTQQKKVLSDLANKTRSAEERFGDGELTLGELILTQAEITEAEIDLIGMEVSYIKNRLSLIAALGLPIETLWRVGDDQS